MKKISVLSLMLLGAALSLQAIPMEWETGERASQPRPSLDRRENDGNQDSSGSASDEVQRGTLGEGIVESSTAAAADEDPNAYLENEICNNIYTACLARVADMTLGKISLPAGTSAEASAKAEWEAAKEMAAEEEEEHKNAWERAKKETLSAQQKLDSANARLHGQAYADEAYYNFQVKELAEQLAEARVRTARATLNAIKFKDTVQRTKAEAKLNEAMEIESKAVNALKEATANTVPKATQVVVSPTAIRNVASLLEAHTITVPAASVKVISHEESPIDERAITPVPTKIPTPSQSSKLEEPSPLPQPPMPLEDKKTIIARKEIATAEAALEEAEAAHKAANIAKAKAGKITLDKEKEAYAAAENLWTETSVVYQSAIAKAKKATLDASEINDLANTLKEAVANAASWCAHAFHIEARKLEQQTPAVGSVEQPQATALESAWRKVSEAFQEAITKNKVAEMEDEELTASLHHAENQKTFWRNHLSDLESAATQAKEEAAAAEAKKIAEQKSFEEKEQAAQAAEYSEIPTVIEQAIEDLRGRTLEAQIKANVVTDAEKNLWEQSAKSFKNAAEYLGNHARAKNHRNEEAAELWKQASEQIKASAEKYNEAAQLKDSKKDNESNRLQTDANMMRTHATRAAYLAYESEAKAAGDQALSLKWSKVIEMNQRSLETFTKAKETKNHKHNIFLNNAGLGYYGVAEKLGKAIEEEKAGNIELAIKWSEAAALQERSIEHYLKAARTTRIDEDISWNNAGRGSYWAAEKLVKAIEEEKAGNMELAAKWREAAVLQEHSVEPCTKAAEIHAAEIAPEKKDTKFAWFNKSSEGDRWNDVGITLFNEAEKLGKAIEEEKAGNMELAAKWREAAVLQQRSLKPYINAAEAHADGKQNEGIGFRAIGLSFFKAANEISNVIEEEKAGNIELAAKWREVVARYEYSVEHFTRAIEAYKAKKIKEGDGWHSAGEKLNFATDMLAKALGEEKARNGAVAAKWREAAALQERSVESYTKAAAAHAAGKTDEGNSWSSAGRSLWFASDQLEPAIISETGNRTESTKNREAAALYKRSAELDTKAAEAHAVGKIKVGNSWNDAANCLYEAARSHEHGELVEATKKISEAEKYIKTAQHLAGDLPTAASSAASATAAPAPKKGFFSKMFGTK